jgi:hypothetical protein
LMRFFIFSRLFNNIFVDRIFQNDSIEFWQVYVVNRLWVIRERYNVFIFGALAKLLPFFMLMPIVVVGFWESICKIMKIFVGSYGL